jgi:hypothetical protein
MNTTTNSTNNGIEVLRGGSVPVMSEINVASRMDIVDVLPVSHLIKPAILSAGPGKGSPAIVFCG